MTERSEELSTADLAEPSRPADRSEAEDEGRPELGDGDRAAEARGRDDDAAEERGEPLLPREESEDFQRRWETVQTDFVDHPQGSVESADTLVAEALKRVAETFSSEREALEEQWGRGEDVSTEDLRVILRRYRSFFNRLLSA